MNTKIQFISLFLLMFLGFNPIINAQESKVKPHMQTPELTAVWVVQKQLDAYNAKDIEAFLAVFNEEAEIYNLGDATPIAKGKDNLRAIYGKLFNDSPNLNSTVINRSVVGNTVFDYELITGRNNNTEPYYLMAIYVIENQEIKTCYFVRK